MASQISNRLPIGNKAVNTPTKIPHRYCVMGYFKMTHAWAEPCPDTKYIRYKFRFELLEFDTDGWWSDHEYSSEELDNAKKMEIFQASCSACGEKSPQVYSEGWMCLKPGCISFWKVGHPNNF
jgi:hypothetical protein